MSEVLHTKFGNCSLNNSGRYRITSRGEGNHGKLLHRLIWEDFYGCEVPNGFVIHHKNGNKTDNCILNLQLMRESEHRRLHGLAKDNSMENNPMYNKTHKYNSKLKMSIIKNKTGIFRVYKLKDARMKQGFRWCYSLLENGKPKVYSSAKLSSLKKKIVDMELEWVILDEDKVKMICDETNEEYCEVI